MNNKLLRGIIAGSGLMLLSSCGDTFNPSSDRVGRILPTVDVDTQVAAPASASAKAKSRGVEYNAVGVADLALRLTSVDGTYGQAWASAVDFPANGEYPVGEYTLEAYYGTEGQEGFELPYYYGKQNLSVLENRTTPVSLTASLANAVITIAYTDEVKNYFKSYNATVRTASGNTIDVAEDEARMLYVNAGKVNIDVNVVRPNGLSAKLEALSFDAVPRNHYLVTFSIDAGTAVLGITFDSEPETVEEEINVSDQVLAAPAPTITLEGLAENTEFIEGTVPENKIRATIVAQGGLKTAVLTTDSPSLLAQGWPAEVDFAAADANTLATLSRLGLEYPGVTEGLQMAMLDFTNVVKNIKYTEGENNTAAFNLVAKDKLSKVSDPLALSFSVSKLMLEILGTEVLYPDATELTVNVKYNGSDIHDVQFSYKDELGMWKPATMKSATEISRSTTGTYQVVLEVPANGTIELRAGTGELQTPTVNVERTNPTHTVAVAENDVFATYASGSLAMTDGSDAATLTPKFFISDNGVTYTEATTTGNTFSAAGLKSATKYYVKAEVGGVMCQPVTFVTEAATQLPNSDMEQWTSTARKSHCVEYFVGGDVWGTLNPLTISQYGDAVDAAYCATSGTLSADGASGSGKCALIRTVGWGSGNTAASGLSVIKHVDRGELYLGKWENNIVDNVLPDYGIAFGSRPMGLSFNYKFTEVKSRKGYVEITVLDKDGNTIATGNAEIGSQASFTNKTVELSYAPNAPKAAKLIVIFRSTNVGKPLGDGSALGKSDVNTASVSSSSVHTGSQLYVDDIALVY